MGLSVVKVCMNRREHLLVSAPHVAAWPHHSQHLIVDWSSREPLRRQDLQADSRIRLLRVEGERAWHLCRAYNFALAQAHGDCLLKLDADVWPTEAFYPADPDFHLPANRLLAAHCPWGPWQHLSLYLPTRGRGLRQQDPGSRPQPGGKSPRPNASPQGVRRSSRSWSRIIHYFSRSLLRRSSGYSPMWKKFVAP